MPKKKKVTQCLPLKFSQLRNLSKSEIRDLCKSNCIDPELPHKARIKLLALKLGISSSGQSKELFVPRITNHGLSPVQLAEFSMLTPDKVSTMDGWTKSIESTPDLDESMVTRFLLNTDVIPPTFKRQYKISRPYQLQEEVHSLHFNAGKDLKTFCLLWCKCNPSQSTSADDVKVVFCILDKITGQPYGGYCTCTAGCVTLVESVDQYYFWIKYFFSIYTYFQIYNFKAYQCNFVVLFHDFS